MNEITTDQQNAFQRRQEISGGRMTTEQLPVYRTASNVLYIFTTLVMSAPRKSMRFCDKATADAAEVLKCIALANSMSGEDRVYYLHAAEANALALKSYSRIFEKLGTIGRNEADRLKKQLKSLTAQLAGWRSSTKCEGH